MENNDFGGGGFWIFALLVLLGMGNGGLFGGNAAAARGATVEDLNNQANATRLENMVQNNGNLTEMKFDGLTKGLCDGFYNNAMQVNNLEKSLTGQIQTLSSKIDQNKIADLTAQVQELKTAQLISGMPKINPYLYGITPYCQCGCNTNI